jgi:transposase
MLTDGQWAVLEPLIEACRPKGRPSRRICDAPSRRSLEAPERSQVAFHAV